MEIERKFLVDSFPPGWRRTSSSKIRQGYFCLCQEGVEIRLRKRDSQFCITIKTGEGRIRHEEELQISRGAFESLWPLVRANSVIKTRYYIPCGKRTIELDIYQGRHRGLKIAEVEFDSKSEARSYQPPTWLGREITGNRRYANEFLARH